MNCKFCNVKITNNGTLKKGKPIYINDDISICIHENSNEMIVETDNFDIAVTLKYCPMCGSELKAKGEE